MEWNKGHLVKGLEQGAFFWGGNHERQHAFSLSMGVATLVQDLAQVMRRTAVAPPVEA